MPDAPPKPCHYPGCRSLAIPGTARCAAHAYAYDTTTRRNSPALREAQRLRGSTAWKRLRHAVMSSSPLCCDPFGVHTLGPEPAIDIHHVQGLLTHPHLALEPTNLRPLCRACHNRVEQMERSGKPTQHLFTHASTP